MASSPDRENQLQDRAVRHEQELVDKLEQCISVRLKVYAEMHRMWTIQCGE